MASRHAAPITAPGHGRLPAQRDPRVVVAAWEEETDPPVSTGAANENSRNRSIVVDQQESYDPFEEDDRLAQLPGDDPFDEPTQEPAEELVPEPVSEPLPEPTPEPTLEPAPDSADLEMQEAKESLEEEIERRHQSGRDWFEDDMHDEFIGDAPLEDPDSEDTDKSDPFKGDDWLDDAIQSTQEQLRDEPDSQQGPDFSPWERDVPEGTRENPNALRKQAVTEQEESDESCAQELAKLRDSGLRSIDLSIRVEGNPGEDYPHECALESEPLKPREWPLLTYSWKASALCHKPLYFEQVRLERYGHSWGPYVQPIMSGVHFFGTVPVLPYKMGIRTPSECVYALGYYRPGSCAPYMIDPVPFTWRAALFQTGAVTGVAAAIP